MVAYPISVTVKPYTGKNPRKMVQYQAKLEAAAKIQAYLNERHVEGEPQVLCYYEIADELGMTKELVHDLLYPVCGGSNGITF